MQVIKCDGCGAELDKLPVNHAKGHREHVIHGERVNGVIGGAPLPNGDFDWCEECAKIAFAAVKAQRSDSPATAGAGRY